MKKSNPKIEMSQPPSSHYQTFNMEAPDVRATQIRYKPLLFALCLLLTGGVIVLALWLRHSNNGASPTITPSLSPTRGPTLFPTPAPTADPRCVPPHVDPLCCDDGRYICR